MAEQSENKAKLYTARITKVNQTLPAAPDGVWNLNCLNFFPNNVMYGIHLDQISPYVLRDSEQHIFECIWQFSKLYQVVEAQYEVKAGKIIWEHPREVHLKDGQLTEAFWKWRKKGWNNPYPVRYANGYHGRSKCLCAIWYENGQWITLPYIPARKKIYCKVYEQLVTKTEAFKQLKQAYDRGQSLQICEMDVRPGLVTEEVLRREINNPHECFGHGYVLCTLIMGLSHIFDE